MVRHFRPQLSLGIALCLTLVVVTFEAAWSGVHTVASDTGPYYQATEQQFIAQGQLTYADRPSRVQAVLRRMYDNNSSYKSFSVLFTSHEPGEPAGSVWIDITQPSFVRTDAYANATGAGSPVEETSGSASSTTVANLQAGVYTTDSHAAPPPLPPLADVHLSDVPVDYSATDITGMASPAATLANVAVHPSQLVVSPFFTDKTITVLAETGFGGRAAWLLEGTQIPGTPVATVLGDRWRMWVDKQTGMILRIEYYSGGALIGWAEMQNVSVDGVGAYHDLAPLSLPTSSRYVGISQYSAALLRGAGQPQLTRQKTR